MILQIVSFITVLVPTAGSFSTEKKGGDLMEKSVINLNSAFPALLEIFFVICAIF